MPRICSVCSHKARRKIDAAIVSGTSYRAIEGRFGASRMALCRHKRHVSMAIERASKRREVSIGESVLARLEGLYKRASRLLDSAEKARNHSASASYLRELRAILAGLYEVSRTAIPNPDQRPPMPEEYVAAINRALGVSGEFKPLIRGEGSALLPGDDEDDVIDLPILP